MVLQWYSATINNVHLHSLSSQNVERRHQSVLPTTTKSKLLMAVEHVAIVKQGTW